MFFGVFLAGPLAGSTFVLKEAGDGGVPIGSLAAGSLLLCVLNVIIFGPFVIWPIILGEFYEVMGLPPLIFFAVCSLLFCVLRFRSGVRHWSISMVREYLFSIVYFCVLILFTIAYASARYIEMYSLEYRVLDVVKAYLSFEGMIQLFIIGGLLSVIPAGIITLLSYLWISKISMCCRRN